jgi:hypothetical protein
MPHTLPIAPGIGRDGDLSVKLQDGMDKWHPQISPGFFYLGARQHYLFASEQTQDIAVGVGLTSTVVPTATIDFRNAAKQGPILFRDTYRDYTRCTNCLECFVSAVPTGLAETLTTSLPTNADLEMVTTNTGEQMRRVYSTDALGQAPNVYLYNEVANTVSVARATGDATYSDPIFLTYRTDSPGLKFSEIRLVDSDGKGRTSLGDVSNTVSYTPVVIVPASGTIAATASGNVITPASGIAEGTLVAINYYLDHSFVVGFGASGQQVVSILSSDAVTGTLSFESGSVTSYKDLGGTPWEYKTRINPTMAGVDGGFLYISSPRPPGETLNQVLVWAAPDYAMPTFGQPIRIKVTAIGLDGTPLPNTEYSVSILKDALTIIPEMISAAVSGNYTDQRGNGYATWVPDGDSDLGSYTVLALAYKADGSIVSGTTEVTLVSPLSYTVAANDPKIHLYMSKVKDSLGFYDLYVYTVDQSGIPYLDNSRVRVTCKRGLLFQTNLALASTQQGSTQITLDPINTQDFRGMSVLSCKYQASVGDQIVAQVYSPSGTATYFFESSPLEVVNA